MSDNVVELQVSTTLDIPPARILSKAIEANLDTVVLMGWGADEKFYVASSTADIGAILLLLDLTRKRLLELADPPQR